MIRSAVLIAAALWASGATAAVKPGLEGAQELYRQNRWADAREHLHKGWDRIPEKDRSAAAFLIGRSLIREAEFYRALHVWAADVGCDYLAELSSAKIGKPSRWAPLFTALSQLEAGKFSQAERGLAGAGAPSPPWGAVESLRRGVALSRLGRASEAAGLLTARGAVAAESAFWQRTLRGAAALPPQDPGSVRERLCAACVLFRAKRPRDAEALLAGIDLDAPDVEEKPDAKKVLRFYDPLIPALWERICWERAAMALAPLAAGQGTESSLAGSYLGRCLVRLGAEQEASAVLVKALADPALPPELRGADKVLQAVASWKSSPLTEAAVQTLWEETKTQSECVLLWAELAAVDLARTQTLSSQLVGAVHDLPQGLDLRQNGAVLGAWGLLRLRSSADVTPILVALEDARDKSNKNKLEWNDPLLLLALSAAHARNTEYAQGLETLFELSKTFSGLRAVQWNLQGIYAARQKAGGEARISQ